ncbi:MAG: ParA family protein [Planctomycetota bacterium]
MDAVKTIALVNQKGGVGKTTLAMNLAACLIEEGYRTLVLDADPQQSASRWSHVHDGPGGVEVVRLDASRPIDLVSDEIQRIAAERRAELAVMDCPPQLRAATEVALLLAELTLVPVGPSPLDIWAAEEVIDFAHDARDVRGDGKPHVALVPSRLSGTVMARDLPVVLEALGEPLAPGITERIVVAESAIVGETLPDYAPKSRSSDEFFALTRFVTEILNGQSETD